MVIYKYRIWSFRTKISAKIVLNKFDYGYKPFLIDISVVICDFLKNTNKAGYHYIIKKLYAVIAPYSNALICNHKVSILEKYVY